MKNPFKDVIKKTQDLTRSVDLKGAGAKAQGLLSKAKGVAEAKGAKAQDLVNKIKKKKEEDPS